MTEKKKSTFDLEPGEAAVIFRTEGAMEVLIPAEEEGAEEISDNSFIAFAICMAMEKKELMDAIVENAYAKVEEEDVVPEGEPIN